MPCLLDSPSVVMTRMSPGWQHSTAACTIRLSPAWQITVTAGPQTDAFCWIGRMQSSIRPVWPWASYTVAAPRRANSAHTSAGTRSMFRMT